MSASHTRRVEDELRRREEMHGATPSQATLSRHAKRERPAARPRQIKWRRHARTLLSAEAMVLLRSLAAALHGHAPSRLWSSGSRCAGLQQDLNFGDSAIELRGDDAPVKSYL